MKSPRESALELCVENYEEAMTLSKAVNSDLEKQLKASIAEFDKLVKIVKHNARNADAILSQL